VFEAHALGLDYELGWTPEFEHFEGIHVQIVSATEPT
jgi:hypothetical protein